VGTFGTTFRITNFTTDDITIHLNKKKTYKLYEQNSAILEHYLPKNIVISYTGDRNDLTNKIIVKTNKYKSISLLDGYKLYEYDDFDHKEIRNIINFYDADKLNINSKEFAFKVEEDEFIGVSRIPPRFIDVLGPHQIDVLGPPPIFTDVLRRPPRDVLHPEEDMFHTSFESL
jgi:hypothetical protein